MAEPKIIDFAQETAPERSVSKEAVDSLLKTAAKAPAPDTEGFTVETITVEASLVTVVENNNERALVAFSTEGGLDPIIEEIERRVEDEIFDVTTEKGRERIGSVARQIGSAKKRLEELALGLTEDWRSKTAAVNEEKKRMVRRMDTLRDKVLAPRDAYLKQEEDRQAAHRGALEWINVQAEFIDQDPDPETILARITVLENHSRDWQEFTDTAMGAKHRVLGHLKSMYDAAIEKKEEEEKARADQARRDAHGGAIEDIVTIGSVNWSTSTVEILESALTALEPFRKREWEEFAARAEDVIKAAEKNIAEAIVARKQYDAEQAELEKRRAEDAENERIKNEREALEKARKEAHEGNIVYLQSFKSVTEEESSASISEKIVTLDTFWMRDYDWQEFGERAKTTYEESNAALCDTLEKAKVREQTEKEIDDERKRLLRLKVMAVRTLPNFDGEPTMEEVSERIDRLENARNFGWQEFEDEAHEAIINAANNLEKAFDAAKERHDAKLRADNLEHKRTINREVMAALLPILQTFTVDESASDSLAKLIVTALAEKKIPHTTIAY